MSNMDREPIELVELVLPRCINTYGTGLCTASGSGDGKCYNTRATCQSVADYRDTPDRHLTADLQRIAGESIGSGEITRDASFFASFEVRFATVPSGTIWQQGGTSVSAYLGITGTDLVFAVGDDGSQARVAVPVSDFAGKSVTLHVAYNLTDDKIYLWSFDPVELSLDLLGEADIGGGGGGGGGVDIMAGIGDFTSSAGWNLDAGAAITGGVLAANTLSNFVNVLRTSGSRVAASPGKTLDLEFNVVSLTTPQRVRIFLQPYDSGGASLAASQIIFDTNSDGAIVGTGIVSKVGAFTTPALTATLLFNFEFTIAPFVGQIDDVKLVEQ